MRIDTFHGQEKKMLFWEDGDNSIKAKEYMIRHGLTGIVFSKHLGFTGNIISMQSNFEFVDEIHIIDSNIKDISFVYHFPNVSIINIQNDDKTKIDFAHFLCLKDVFLTWRKGVVNLFNNKGLTSLKIEKFKEKSLYLDSNMGLEELWIYSSPLDDLSSVRNLRNIRSLKLAQLRCLEDVSWIRDMVVLEEMLLISCKKISKTVFDNITELVRIKRIYMEKMGDIPSIQLVEYLKNLEEISLIDNTRIVDGNLHSLLGLLNLKKITIQEFKHYRPSVSEIESNILLSKSPIQ